MTGARRAVRLFALFLLCLALVAIAGCGGGDDEAGEETVATTEADTAGLASDECLELLGIGAALSEAFTGGSEANAEETSALFAELVDEAPDEIKADIETVAAGYAQYVDALRDLDLQAGKAPSAEQLQEIQAAIAAIDQPELQAAAERLSAWAEANC